MTDRAALLDVLLADPSKAAQVPRDEARRDQCDREPPRVPCSFVRRRRIPFPRAAAARRLTDREQEQQGDIIRRNGHSLAERVKFGHAAGVSSVARRKTSGRCNRFHHLLLHSCHPSVIVSGMPVCARASRANAPSSRQLAASIEARRRTRGTMRRDRAGRITDTTGAGEVKAGVRKGLAVWVASLSWTLIAQHAIAQPHEIDPHLLAMSAELVTLFINLEIRATGVLARE